MTLHIRPETPGDETSICEITQQAFASHPHSNQTEHFIIDGLRKANAMTISLVAQVGDTVVGHIAFSPVEISDGTPGWFGLGPIAVSLENQRKGIGSELVRAGLDRLKKLGAMGCVLAGDPAFYGRFGFRVHPGLELPGLPAEYFLALPVGQQVPTGIVTFHKAFEAKQ
jgi:predicted N-acetyltransferase YhbS